MTTVAALQTMARTGGTYVPSGVLYPWDDVSKNERLRTLAAVLPDARVMFEKLIAEATSRGMKPSIISAARNCQEAPGPVSPERGWHTYGRAIDLQLLSPDGSAVKPEPYLAMGEWWEAQGGVWGGRWTKEYPDGTPCLPHVPGDFCHYQWTPDDMSGRVTRDIFEGKTCDEARTAYYRAAWPSSILSDSRSRGGGGGGVLLVLGAAVGAVFAFGRKSRS
jgi:hypothetical protein